MKKRTKSGRARLQIDSGISEHKDADENSNALIRISKKLNSTLDVDALMDSLIREAMKLAGAEIGWTGLRAAEGMVCHKCFQNSRAIPFTYCWPPGVGWPGWVLVHKVPYLSNDASTDTVIVPEIREKFGVKAGIDTPLLDAAGNVIGFFEVNNKKANAGFTQSDVRKLVAVSQVASVAVQNALAYRKIRQEEEALRQLSARLLTLQDEERRRMARDLHDSTVQELSALSINLTRVKRSAASLSLRLREVLDECLAIAEKCTSDIRTLSYLLHPPLLDEKGLISALRLYLDGIAKSSTVKVRLDVPEHLGRLSPDVEMTAFRIIQEGLTNIHRHSGSPTGHIRIFRNDEVINLEIQDQGRGMSARTLEKIQAGGCLGVGISGMRERVKQLCGSLEVISSSQGTTVRAIIPLAEGKSEDDSHPGRR